MKSILICFAAAACLCVLPGCSGGSEPAVIEQTMSQEDIKKQDAEYEAKTDGAEAEEDGT